MAQLKVEIYNHTKLCDLVTEIIKEGAIEFTLENYFAFKDRLGIKTKGIEVFLFGEATTIPKTRFDRFLEVFSVIFRGEYNLINVYINEPVEKHFYQSSEVKINIFFLLFKFFL